MSDHPEVQMTLDDAVAEVLGMLTGLDLTYEPELDRYRAIVRQLNRALRANALEQEWSWYASTLNLGNAQLGNQEMILPTNKRPRIINDDAVQMVNSDGVPVQWAYFLPRDALSKYRDRRGMWCASTRRAILFSRPFNEAEQGLEILLPVMREPYMFRLPANKGTTVSNSIRKQLIDFSNPDAVITRAAYYFAMADPVMQPRAQTLEAEYKDVMYQLIERDVANTDTPFENQFMLPIQPGLRTPHTMHTHPHAE